MTWPEPTRCSLCGNLERRDLTVRLVHWKDALPGMAFDQVDACSDRDACRARVVAAGEPWPLVESKSDLLKGDAA